MSADPSSLPPTQDPDPPSTTSCASFWGPFRPYFGAHTLSEAATSIYIPTPYVFAWRLAFASFLLTTAGYFLATGTYNLRFYSTWSHLGLALAFTSTATASLSFLARKQAPDPRFSPLAAIAVPLFQIFASAALFLDLVYWALLFEHGTTPEFQQLAQHAFNLVFVLLDMFLSLRMQFRMSYALAFVLFTLVYVAFAWVRFWITGDWVYRFLDYRTKSAGLTVAYYVGILLWGLLAALIVLSLSRVRRCPCVAARGKERRENSFEEEEAVAV